MIRFEEFKAVQLKIGEVKTAERVPGSGKLLKLNVDIGTEIRQIVAGIGAAYPPETLVGKKIVIVANLEPKTLLGIESQGMLLAAGADTPVLLIPDKDVNPGAEVR